MQKEIEAIISGRVQMVMYRDFAQRKARKLGVVGTVQNLKNGTVRVVAQGSEDVLNTYITHLHTGSLLARVDTVAITWNEPRETFSDFTIVF